MRLGAGLGWTTAGTAVSQVAALVRLLMVTAVVGLDDLGLYAIAASLTAAAGLLGDSGLRQLYLSRQATSVEPDPDVLLATVWTGIVGAHVLIVLASVPIALLASMHVGGGSLVSMAAAIAGCSALGALHNPALLAREAAGEFGPSIKSESVGQVVSLLVVALLVLHWPTVWLLVVGQAVAAAASVVTSYTVAAPLRGLRPRWGSLQKLVRAGRAFLWISATTYVTASFDKLLLGLMLSPSAAGTFFLAQRLADAPRQLHASVLGRTVLPLYASAHAGAGPHDLRHVLRAYLVMTTLAFAAAIGIALAAAMLLPDAVLDGKWRPVAYLVPVLLVGTGLRAACHVVGPGLIVLGRVDQEARLKVQEALFYFAALPLAIKAGGIDGAAWSFAFIYAVALFRRYRAVLFQR